MEKFKHFVWKFYKPIVIVGLVVVFNYVAAIPSKLLLLAFRGLPELAALCLTFGIILVVCGIAGVFLYKKLLPLRDKLLADGGCKECTCTKNGISKTTEFKVGEESISVTTSVVKGKDGSGFLKVVCGDGGEDQTWSARLNYCPICGGKYTSKK